MALGAALSVALGQFLYKVMGSKLTSDMIGYVRMFVALPALIILTLIFDKGIFLNASPKAYAALLFSGIIGYFLCDLFLFKSIVDLGPRETSVVMTLNPAISALMALALFGEALSGRQILGMALTVLGISVMILGEARPDSGVDRKILKSSLIFALVAAVTQSMADVSAKFAMEEVPSVTLNMIRVFGAFWVWIVFGFIRRKSYKEQFKVFKDWRYVVMIICASSLGPVIGMTLTMGAMSRIPVGIVKSITQISPILLIPMDVLFLHKKVTLISMIGTVVSVAGVVLLF